MERQGSNPDDNERQLPGAALRQDSDSSLKSKESLRCNSSLSYMTKKTKSEQNSLSFRSLKASKSIEHDKKANIVYVHIKKGIVEKTETVYDADVLIVIDTNKKGDVLGVEII